MSVPACDLCGSKRQRSLVVSRVFNGAEFVRSFRCARCVVMGYDLDNRPPTARYLNMSEKMTVIAWINSGKLCRPSPGDYLELF
jgi:hypothetical protein